MPQELSWFLPDSYQHVDIVSFVLVETGEYGFYSLAAEGFLLSMRLA